MSLRPSSRALAGVAAASLLALAGCGSVTATSDVAGGGGKKAAPTAPTTITRWPAAKRHDGTGAVSVRLSAAPAASSPRPTISPKVAGTWTTSGTSEVFRPKGTLAPCTSYTVTVPAGTTATGARRLGHARRHHVSVACPSTRAIQVALARLDYLPYRLHRTAAGSGASSSAASSSAPAGTSSTAAPGTASATTRTVALHGAEPRAAAAATAFSPASFRLEKRWSAAPSLDVGSLDQETKGAIMAFQSDHGLTVDGLPGKAVWASILGAEQQGRESHHPYTWITVTKGSAERLVLHREGSTVLTTPANTGGPGAETAAGTFPIFEHLAATEMIGTNADGSKYDDPGVKYVSYFNGGDAVHAFERASYGTPQSNGCVELPEAAAASVFGKVRIGDLVIVS